jgi:superfamily II RNA helicase
MAVLTRDDILQAKDIKIELVPTPGWGGEVYVKGLNGAERDKFEGSLIIMRGKDKQMNMANIRAKLASMSICDEKGKRLFNENDVQALSQKSAAELQRVFAVAQRLSGISDEDVEELAEELKNDPFDGSPTD